MRMRMRGALLLALVALASVGASACKRELRCDRRDVVLDERASRRLTIEAVRAIEIDGPLDRTCVIDFRSLGATPGVDTRCLDANGAELGERRRSWAFPSHGVLTATCPRAASKIEVVVAPDDVVTPRWEE